MNYHEGDDDDDRLSCQHDTVTSDLFSYCDPLDRLLLWLRW